MLPGKSVLMAVSFCLWRCSTPIPMRFRLLRRRLTISAPRMAVRSAMPWPLRWVVVAIVLGFCAAIGLWAFEFGKDIAGLDKDAKEELVKLRDEAQRLREEREKAQSVATPPGSPRPPCARGGDRRGPADPRRARGEAASEGG